MTASPPATSVKKPQSDRQLAIHGVLAEALDVRVSYAQWLALSYELVEQGRLPYLKPENVKSSSGMLDALHIALATELYKMSETIGGLCLAAEDRKDPHGLHSAMNAAPWQVDRFYDALTPEVPLERILNFYPYPQLDRLELDAREEVLARRALGATARSTLRFMLFLKKQREFLKPFRNKFSHSFDFATFTDPSAASAGRKFVPLIRSDAEAVESGLVTERILLPSVQNQERLLRMFGLARTIQREIVHARRLHLLNGRAVFPAKIWWDHSSMLTREEHEQLDRAVRRQGYIFEWNGTVRFEPSASRFDEADQFYARQWSDEQCTSDLR